VAYQSTSNVFNRGELDPSLYARIDLPIYNKGCRKLRNMMPLWTGAARVAPGTKYVDVIVDRTNSNAPITDYTQVIGADFQYDADNDLVYTVIFRPDTTSTVAIDSYDTTTLLASTPAAMYTVANVKDLHFVPGQHRLLVLLGSVQPQQVQRGATPATWTIGNFAISVKPTYDFTVVGGTQYRVAGFTFTPAATTGTGINLTASGAIFTNNHVGGLFQGNGGTMRITSITSTTVAVGTITAAFASTAAIAGTSSILTEVMWTSGGGVPAGADRGWPERGRYYTNRLVLGRSPAIPNFLAFSVAGVFDNFDDETADATSGFNVGFNGTGASNIQTILSHDSFVVLTSNQVFAQSPLVENAISPGNFYAPPNCQSPASETEAVVIDNRIFHASLNKTQIMHIGYETQSAKYVAQPATLLSSHLVESISSNGTWEPNNVQARLYLATQDNGSMLMLNTLMEEAVMGWSLRTTPGKFRQVIADSCQASSIVERQVSNLASGGTDALDYLWISDSTFAAFDLLDQGAATNAIFTENNNYLVVAHPMPWRKMTFTLGTVSSANLALTFEYLNANGQWETFTPTDATTGMTVNGAISWTFADVAGWVPKDLNLSGTQYDQLFWLRIQRTEATVVTTPEFTSVISDLETRLYLERFDFETYTDATSNTSSNATGAVTGLTHLAGHQVYAIANGVTTGPFFVDETGATNVGKEYSSVDIGIFVKPILQPMPVYTPTQEGDNLYQEKYIRDVYLDYVDSLYMTVDDQPVPLVNAGAYTLGQTVPPQTGVHIFHTRPTWDPRETVTVSQALPGPMTVIGIGYHVEIT